MLYQKAVSLPVLEFLVSFSMLPSIDFNNQFCLWQIEVYSFRVGSGHQLVRRTQCAEKLMSGANSERVDFYLPQAELVIEIDGGQHGETHQKLKDRQRDSFLVQH
ncbi:unnamed protein product, partial [Nesidiocoris tenuis]